jgi:thiamine-monophosphate kinase
LLGYIYRALPLQEKSLIRRIRAQAAGPHAALVQGIGDDCAVLRLPARHEALVTTDFSLEDVHFRRRWHSAESVGHRCLARGLSDIAAMGGEPLAAFLSLALPPDISQTWVDGFFRGFASLARQFGVALAGGDTAQSTGGVLADIMVLGAVPAGRAILRSGARGGDYIYVTGELGRAFATLDLLRSGKKVRARAHPAHFFPAPRVAVGRALREKKLASAAIDISDGLSTDMAHICEESGVGAVLVGDKIPRGALPLEFALHGGDDYELLFTAGPTARVPATIGGVPITRIGEVIAGRSMWLLSADGRRSRLKPQGWEHFAR